ncbi:hypothetical protein QBC40DRAFT_317946 [Triangularia verruculosa]|uniref:DUF6594 domain-containing protein n=1 Tax=Triangularia verruculosa TaxID=2587418 RepID=A0AAN6XMU1_9PEZI|nr:hypothetical protein QBC40DRAFT_317946 [Triangularia verruculosa]
MELTDEATLESVSQELNRYSTAVRNYRLFREDMHLFAHDSAFDEIVSNMAALHDLRAVQRTEPNNPNSKNGEKIDKLREKIDHAFVSAVRLTTSGITADSKAKAKKALASRLLMALGGAVALVGPMLVMVLHPTKLTSILTTSCCVIAAAVCLAVFMVDSQPKDVLACTAAWVSVNVCH